MEEQNLRFALGENNAFTSVQSPGVLMISNDPLDKSTGRENEWEL